MQRCSCPPCLNVAGKLHTLQKAKGLCKKPFLSLVCCLTVMNDEQGKSVLPQRRGGAEACLFRRHRQVAERYGKLHTLRRQVLILCSVCSLSATLAYTPYLNVADKPYMASCARYESNGMFGDIGSYVALGPVPNVALVQ